MSEQVRPIILLSECLGIRPVRYDGNIVFDNFVEALIKYVDIVPICPEVGIGLSTPRNPLILYLEKNSIELVDTVTRHNYTRDMEEYAHRILRNIVIDGALLKSASPSCGVGDAKLYSEERRVIRKTDGLFTSILKNIYSYIPVESEKRMYNYEIRRRFLIKVFSLADLRTTLSNIGSVDKIVDFHRRYKYLIMLHSPSSLKRLGRLVADRKNYSMNELVEIYRKEFITALVKNPTRKAYANVFLHVYSHFKEELKSSERRFIINLINKYKSGNTSLRVVIEYFRGFIHRFNNKYLAEQKLLAPYPEELDYIGLEVE